MKGFAVLLLAVILCSACKKDIQNKEAVRQGVVDYLAKRTDLMAMDVTVSAVSFRKDEADATVYLQAKGGPAAGGGMEMRYALERKDDKWVVKPKSGAISHGAGMPAPTDAAPPTGTLPPGHPPAGNPQ